MDKLEVIEKYKSKLLEDSTVSSEEKEILTEIFEKPIPREPDRTYYWGFCPRCKGLLGDVSGINVSGRLPDHSIVYCNLCGQALTDTMGYRGKMYLDTI